MHRAVRHHRPQRRPPLGRQAGRDPHGQADAAHAGRFLTRHGYGRDGLAVSVGYEMAADRPARVGGIRLTVRVPAGLPPERWAALRAVVSHCTVHNSLASPPSITIDLQ